MTVECPAEKKDIHWDIKYIAKKNLWHVQDRRLASGVGTLYESLEDAVESVLLIEECK
tara:strand:- start:186 stop:359 length:174 start_codon:yes stop_codon:yes gene_type:complete